MCFVFQWFQFLYSYFFYLFFKQINKNDQHSSIFYILVVYSSFFSISAPGDVGGEMGENILK